MWKQTIQKMKSSFFSEDLQHDIEELREQFEELKQAFDSAKKPFRRAKKEVWEGFVKKMGFRELQQRLWDATKDSAKSIWKNIEQEMVDEGNPSFSHIRDGVKREFVHFSDRLSDEFSGWVQEEFRKKGINWESLFADQSELESAYAVLGLEYGAEITTVKERWRSLMLKHHPDRFMSDPEKYEAATRKTQSLTSAYNTIVKYT